MTVLSHPTGRVFQISAGRITRDGKVKITPDNVIPNIRPTHRTGGCPQLNYAYIQTLSSSGDGFLSLSVRETERFAHFAHFAQFAHLPGAVIRDILHSFRLDSLPALSIAAINKS